MILPFPPQPELLKASKRLRVAFENFTTSSATLADASETLLLAREIHNAASVEYNAALKEARQKVRIPRDESHFERLCKSADQACKLKG